MNSIRSLKFAAAALLLCLVASVASAKPAFRGDDRSRRDPGEVLTRGPVHEAFAEAVVLDPEPSVLVPESPPEAIEEIPPDERPDGDNIAWIPGYWAWDLGQRGYVWISGVWRAIPPGREWVPGYWSRTDGGYRWVAGYWADLRSQEVTYLPEPPDTIDEGPNIPAPADDYIWVPGSWVWHHGRYAWRPGYWIRGQRDWMYVPSHYVWSPRGYVYSDAYWDYDLERRGVLFAPVYFEPEVYHRRHFSYSPTVVINLFGFVSNLFLRPRDCHYYVGDYYDDGYYRQGFLPAYEVRSYRVAYDPVFVHERFVHRGDRDWDRHYERDFDDRRRNPDRRPPRTFEAMRGLASRGQGSSLDRGLAMATTLKQFTSRSGATGSATGSGSLASAFNFRKVAENDRKSFAQKGQDLIKSIGERRQLESTSAVKPVTAAVAPFGSMEMLFNPACCLPFGRTDKS